MDEMDALEGQAGNFFDANDLKTEEDMTEMVKEEVKEEPIADVSSSKLLQYCWQKNYGGILALLFCDL